MSNPLLIAELNVAVSRLWNRIDADKIDIYVAAERTFGRDDDHTQNVLASVTRNVNSLIWC